MLTINERQIKFEMWDTAGQERYRALAPMYYRNADAAVLVYGMTSFDFYVIVLLALIVCFGRYHRLGELLGLAVVVPRAPEECP